MTPLNIAIVAHVDHGKTTLVDALLRQTGMKVAQKRAMDSNELEQERGITILSKNTGITWQDKQTNQAHRINIVDTPGHADFGGEVERILSMVDSVLLLVDAVEGPMPQTRFVTQKAFSWGLKPIVVVNKIDRPNARPDWVLDQVFELFDQLGASDEQLDFPVVYASALQGIAGEEAHAMGDDMAVLFRMITEQVKPREIDESGSFQMQLSSLDYSSYVGGIGIGRINRGQVRGNQPVKVIASDGQVRSGKILQVLGFQGLTREEVDVAYAGDIVAVTGLDGLRISDTLCDPSCVEAMTPLTVDEPTVTMTFQVNDSPFAGKEGKFVTSRQLKERLERELLSNVALRVESGERSDQFRVSGRGELHLSILLETMRREGYELAVSKPQVVVKEEGGERTEPYERVTVNVEEAHQGSIIQYLSEARGQLQQMHTDQHGRAQMDYIIPTRGLIGFHARFLTMTSGTGLLYHVFDHFGPYQPDAHVARDRGVLIANCMGTARAYALWNLESRGRLLISPQTEVYEGMVVGIHTRDNDLMVNVTKEKQLTNVRASGSDENIQLTPIQVLTLEQSLDFIDDDELVELTPANLRLRKRLLLEHERKRASRQASSS